jgi:hypothetical protein
MTPPFPYQHCARPQIGHRRRHCIGMRVPRTPVAAPREHDTYLSGVAASTVKTVMLLPVALTLRFAATAVVIATGGDSERRG